MSTLHHAHAAVHSDLVPPDLYELQCEDFSAQSAEWSALAGDYDAPAPAEPTLPFAEWVECQAAYFRSLGNAGADWLAAEISELAGLARFFRAETPDELDGRRAAADDDARRELSEWAYDEGVKDAKAIYGPAR